MSEVAIQVENLGKKYKLGTNRAADLRNAFGDFISKFKSPDPKHVLLKPQISKHDFWALKDIGFEVKKGEAIGIIGRNGAGKSTLLKILSRITDPTTGHFTLNGRVSSLLEVGTGFHMELTGRENVYLNGTILGMKRREIRQKFDEIVDFSGVEQFIDTPVKHYSSGMKVRLAFSVAAHLEPEILLIDEVLAVGDSEFQKKCLGKMEDVTGQGRTVLFVSHNMGAIKKLCEETILLENGRLRIKGITNEVISSYLDDGSDRKIKFDNAYIKEALIFQSENAIILEAKYSTQGEFTEPHLGFVLYDQGSNPICGSNPKLSDISFDQKIKTDGIIQISILSPVLNDGTYHVSLWFGDGKEDFFIAEHCLSLHYENKSYTGKKPKFKFIGPVKPKAEWKFV